ncbi:heterokaryon incompatibility protein-domain-containing protein [Cladorrhinum sp. PSN259]|nr:heterokaryon incompatibility protein-domain-containing protein [Cladorrhinum sp. PSN259]
MYAPNYVANAYWWERQRPHLLGTRRDLMVGEGCSHFLFCQKGGHPGTLSRPRLRRQLTCHLVVSDLDSEKNCFEALSYVWGNQPPDKPIQVNGETWLIRENLQSALFNLRSLDDTRVLWVDAICIDQTNDDEKIVQVGMMGDIYRYSLRTVVWFGNATQHSRKVFAQIEKLRDWASSVPVMSQEALRDSYQDWNSFFANTWWERAWTLQEIILAESALLVMGTENVDWRVLCDAIRRATLLDYFPRGVGAVAAPAQTEVLDKLQAITSLQVDFKTPGDQLLYYLACTSGRKATVPRDKLFSVLGLVQDTIQDDEGIALKPNYKSEPADVYSAAARAIVNTCHNLDALGFCQQTDLPLPSWVPDWGKTDDLNSAAPLLQDARGNRRTTHASRGIPCNPHWDGDNKILVVQGQKLDRIARLTEAQPKWHSKVVVTPDSKFAFTTWSSMEDFKDALQRFFAHARQYIAWEGFVKTSLGESVAPSEAMTIFRETLTTGVHQDGSKTLKEREESFQLWLHCNRSMVQVNTTTDGTITGYNLVPQGIINKNDRNFRNLIPENFEGVLREDLDAVYLDVGTFGPYLGHTANRKLGITEGSPRRLCLLPLHTQVNDLLVIPRGGRFPVILRPIDGPGNCVKFIGEAYVHGIMDGQVFRNNLCEEFRIY